MRVDGKVKGGKRVKKDELNGEVKEGKCEIRGEVKRGKRVRKRKRSEGRKWGGSEK